MFVLHPSGSGAAAVRAAKKRKEKKEKKKSAKAERGLGLGQIEPEGPPSRARVQWVWNGALLDPNHVEVDGALATKRELGMREVRERGGAAPPKVSTAMGPVLPDDELDADSRSHAHYFEVVLAAHESSADPGTVRATVGLCVNGCAAFAEDASLTAHALGFNTFTGTFHSGRRLLARAQPRVSAAGPAATMVAPGDRVGVYYDGRDDTVTFHLNGDRLAGGSFRVFALPLGQRAPPLGAAVLRAGGAAARGGVPPPGPGPGAGAGAGAGAGGQQQRSLAQRRHDTTRRRREGPGIGAAAPLDHAPCEVQLETVWDHSAAHTGGGEDAPLSRRPSKPPSASLRPFVSLRSGTSARLHGGIPGSTAAPPCPAGASAALVSHLATMLQANAAARGFAFEVRAKVAAVRITAVWVSTRDATPALAVHGGAGAHRITAYAVDEGGWGGKGEAEEAFEAPQRWRAVGSAELGFDAASGASPDGATGQVRVGITQPGVRVERGETLGLYLHCPGSTSAIGYNVTPTFGNTNASNDYVAIQVGTVSTGERPFEGFKFPQLGSLAGSVEYEIAEKDFPPKSA